MRLIWNKNMYVNTVHVEDLCHAITHLVKDGVPGNLLITLNVKYVEMNFRSFVSTIKTLN